MPIPLLLWVLFLSVSLYRDALLHPLNLWLLLQYLQNTCQKKHGDNLWSMKVAVYGAGKSCCCFKTATMGISAVSYTESCCWLQWHLFRPAADCYKKCQVSVSSCYKSVIYIYPLLFRDSWLLAGIDGSYYGRMQWLQRVDNISTPEITIVTVMFVRLFACLLSRI